MASAIPGVPIPKVRELLRQARDLLQANREHEEPMYGTALLTTRSGIEVTLQQFCLIFTYGHHKKRQKKAQVAKDQFDTDSKTEGDIFQQDWALQEFGGQLRQMEERDKALRLTKVAGPAPPTPTEPQVSQAPPPLPAVPTKPKKPRAKRNTSVKSVKSVKPKSRQGLKLLSAATPTTKSSKGLRQFLQQHSVQQVTRQT